MRWNGTELVGYGPSNGSDIVTQIAGLMVGLNATSTSSGYSNVTVTLSGAYNSTYNTGVFLIPFISNPGSKSTANLLGLSPGASGLFNGTGYFGFIAGWNNGTDIAWSLSGIYIHNNGTIGKLSTSSVVPYHGSLYANGTWEGTGYIELINKGTLTLSPTDLYPESPYLKEETLFGRAGGAYNGTAYLKNYRFGNETWGILIGGSSGDFYSGASDRRLGFVKNEGPTYYLIEIHSSSSSGPWGSGDFINATHLGGFYPIHIFDNASSSSSSYTAVMVGESYFIPLAFGSGVGVLENNGFMRWNGTAFETLGPSVTITLANGTSFNSTTTQMTGYMGGYLPWTPWSWNSTSDIGFVMLGRQNATALSQAEAFVLDFVKYDPYLVNATNPSQFNIGGQRLSSAGAFSANDTSYKGLIVGVPAYSFSPDYFDTKFWLGLGIGLYIKGNETGIIRINGLTGEFYNDLEMWKATGLISPESKGMTTYNASDLYDGGPALDSSNLRGKISGSDISGMLEGWAWKIKDQDWRVFAGVSVGSINGTGSTITARMGGVSEHKDGTVDGYFLGDLSLFRGYSVLTTLFTGYRLDEKEYGAFSGDVRGYENGTNYRLVFRGNETSAPLSFSFGVGVLPNAGFLTWNSTTSRFEPIGELMSGNKTGIQTRMTGYIGVLEDLWSANSTDNARSFKSLGMAKLPTITGDYFRLPIQSHVGPDDLVDPVDHCKNNIACQGPINNETVASYGAGYLGSIIGVDYLNGTERMLQGLGYALYIKPNNETGVIKFEDMNGTIHTGLDMWEATGKVYAVSLGNASDFGVTASEPWKALYNGSGVISVNEYTGGNHTLYNDTTPFLGSGGFSMKTIALGNGTLGLWLGEANAQPSSLIFSTPFQFESMYVAPDNSTVISTYFNNTSAGLFIAPTYGYFGSIASSEPITGILVGETIGQFDASKFTAQQMGVFIETRKLLSMLETQEDVLRNLKIPTVIVGSATFNGGNSSVSISLNDVIFLANNSGAKALIWATGNVNGTYSSPPSIGSPITLSSSTTGVSGSVDFTFKKWESNKWLAEIQGSGISLGSSPNDNLKVQGVGAGRYSDGSPGTISGTAAGIVK
jgi:hypothetical protein